MAKLKLSIKDRIDGNELDLSLNQLTEVPVSDLASAVKATHIDLSCNKIKVLPNNFSILTHLVKIDLSKNQLIDLPHNFGNLVNLQYLDLYGNNIEMLPVSFCRLKNLRWLDLKNNPLDPKLKVIAGDCLDQKQCQACAKNVVSFMQGIESELERQKQKKLKEERIKEAERKEKQAQELAEQRKKKKEEREQRKIEAQLRKVAKKLDDQKNATSKQKRENPEFRRQNSSTGSWCSRLIHLSFALVLILFMALTCHSLIDKGFRVKQAYDLPIILQESYIEFRDALIVWWQAFALPYFLSLTDGIVHWIQSTF